MRIRFPDRDTGFITFSRGEEIVVLLCGGDKSSQDSDFRAAKKLASELED